MIILKLTKKQMAPGTSPEILKEVFEHFNNDLNSLYSTLFVCKRWSYISVQILWKNPIELDLDINKKNGLIDRLIILLQKNKSGTRTFYNYPLLIKYCSWPVLRELKEELKEDGKIINLLKIISKSALACLSFKLIYLLYRCNDYKILVNLFGRTV